MDTFYAPLSVGIMGFDCVNLVIVMQSLALCQYLNPLSPNSDHCQFSPNNIHMLPREMVMRINKMITKEKML